MSYTKLALSKTNDLSTSNTWALYTKPSGNFTNTETSMYSEVISLASTTGYGGASLGNQTERYLCAIATDGNSVVDAQTDAKYTDYLNNTRSVENVFSTESAYTFTPNHTTFSAMQTALEDDGKHFITASATFGGAPYNIYFLIVDKNSLGGGSGSSSSSGTSLTSWAYSSQSATDPNILLDWTTPTPDFSITEDTTDWKADILAKVTAKGLNIDSLVADYLFEQSIRDVTQKLSFKDYVINKIN